jgi:hypothetical protein
MASSQNITVDENGSGSKHLGQHAEELAREQRRQPGREMVTSFKELKRIGRGVLKKAVSSSTKPFQESQILRRCQQGSTPQGPLWARLVLEATRKPDLCKRLCLTRKTLEMIH